MIVETRQILTMIIIIVVFFLLSLMSVVGIYFYKPSVLGFPDFEKPDTTGYQFIIDEIPVTPTINISENKLKFFEETFEEKKQLEFLRDSLFNRNSILSDSINSLHKLRREAISDKRIADSLLQDTLQVINRLSDSIFTLNINLKKSNNKLENYQQIVKDQEDFILQEADSMEVINFEEFAKIYNNTNANEVAKILEQIDERDAAKILKQMSAKKAGKVLEAMTPENAAAILLLGAGK